MSKILATLGVLLASIAMAAPASAADATSERSLPHEIDPAIAARLDRAKPLYDLRTGISEDGPNSCTTRIVSDVNPGSAAAGSLEAGPPKYLVDQPTPGSWRHCFHVRNRSPEPRTLTFSTVDVVGSPDPGVTLDTTDEPTAAGSWITLAVPQVTLAPGELVRVPYLIDIPQDPPKGSVGAGIRISDPTPGEGSTAVTRSLIVQLGLQFPGGEGRTPTVLDVDSTRFIWGDRSPNVTRATFTVRNDGTVIDTVTPQMKVTGLFGRTLDTSKSTPEVLLPKSAYRSSLRWSDVPFAGIYKPTVTIKSVHGDRVVELPRVIVVPTWPWLVLFGVSIALLVFGFVRNRRNRWQQYLEDDESDYEDYGPDFET